MSKKLCKVWNTKLKKILLASSFQELIFEGSKKLNIENEQVHAFLEDGTEIDDDKIFWMLPSGVIIYLLTDEDKKPWDKRFHENDGISNYWCYCPSMTQEDHIFLPCSISLSFPSSSYSKILQSDSSWETESELLEVICDEITKYTLMPTANLIDIIARQLIKQIPNLKSSIGEGHEDWSVKIYDRMKNNLKKTSAFSRKRKTDSEAALLKYSPSPKNPRKSSTRVEIGNKSVEDAKKFMCDEMKKLPSKRDLAAIEESLKVSFCDRKRLIESEIPLEDLQTEYPAFFTMFGIGYDFYTANKIVLQSSVLMSLHTCSSAVLKYAEKKNDELLKPLRLSAMGDNVNNLLVMTTMLIPEILQEKPEFIYKVYPAECELKELEEMPVTPHLCVIGDPFLSSEIYIVAENKILIECHGFLEGIATLIGFYFVANIEYPAKAVATYKFFQSYILKLPCKKLPSKLITFCKALPQHYHFMNNKK